MPPRIVVDTNVFIGAILSPAGENRELLRACLHGMALPLMGAALFHEYEDLLGRSALMAKTDETFKDIDTHCLDGGARPVAKIEFRNEKGR